VRDVSADGKTILFDETGVGGGESHSVYVRDLDGSPAVKLGDGINPTLSPDGRWALTYIENAPNQIVLLPTGAGQARAITTGGLIGHNVSWFPDGKRACVVGSEGESGLRLYEVDIKTGAPRAFSEEGVNPDHILVSPNGEFVVARGPDLKYMLYPLDGSPAKAMKGVGVEERAFGWNEDGSELFVFQRGALPAKIFRVDVGTGERSLHRELSPSDPTGVEGLAAVRMTPDASTFVYSFPQALSDLYVIGGLR